MGMEKFLIREKANQGVKVYLPEPGTELASEDWLIIRSRWSDEFQAAKNEALQRAFDEAKLEDVESKKKAALDRKLMLHCSLVADWSFEQPCTTENVMAFLRDAPQIAAKIDEMSANDSLFFKSASVASSAGLKKK